MKMSHEQLSLLILRIGVSSAFIYPAIDSFLHPNAWVGYFPMFLRDFAGDETLLISWAITELLVGIWILSGWRIFIPSIIAVLSLMGIVLFNFSQIQVVFRDIALLAPALVLALSAIRKRHTRLRETSSEEGQMHT